MGVESLGKTTLLYQISLVSLVVLVVYLQEGISGLRAFMSLWQIALVYGGTIILTLARVRAFPADMPRPWLPIARDAAILLGVLAALIGAMLVLVSIDDVAQLPRHLAYCLTGLVHGIFISEILLAPHDRTASGDGERSGRMRWLAAGFAATVVVSVVFAIYAALSAALSYDRPAGESRQFSIPIEQISFVPGKTEMTLSSQEKLRPLLDIVKRLSLYHSRVELRGSIPLDGDSELARKRLYSVAGYLAKAGIEVSIVWHIGQSSQWGCSPRVSKSEFLKAALPDEFPKVDIAFYARGGKEWAGEVIH